MLRRLWLLTRAANTSVACECGCGEMYPAKDMIAIKTSRPDKPYEYIYRPHAEKIYGKAAVREHPNFHPMSHNTA